MQSIYTSPLLLHYWSILCDFVALLGATLLQDIPRTADRAPSRSFYTFSVNLNSAYKRLAGAQAVADLICTVLIGVV